MGFGLGKSLLFEIDTGKLDGETLVAGPLLLAGGESRMGLGPAAQLRQGETAIIAQIRRDFGICGNDLNDLRPLTPGRRVAQPS